MQIFDELKRRNVFRVAAAYIVSAWLIIQVVETIFPVFGFGADTIRIVIVTLGIGLVPVVVFSWVFELTPEGLKLDKDVDLSKSIGTRTGKKLDQAIVMILALALSYFAFDKFVLDPARDAEKLETARQEGRKEAIIASVGQRSIAVLPFTDMSPQRDQSYFSEGISEELLNLLASIPEVRVTSRSSAFSFRGKGLSVPEIAEQLNVVYVLDGSVRKAGDQLRISTQLIDARSDTQLWSRNFDRTLQNIFQIQDEIAADVVDQIKGTLQIAVPRQRETNPEAYAIYLKARYQRRLGTAAGYEESLRLYKEALAIDPDFPPAWDELAASYQSQGVTGLMPAEEAFELAREAALKAIEIDPQYAPAYDTLGYLAQYYQTDLAKAAAYYRRALQLAPNNVGIIGSAGILLQTMGRIEEGLPPIAFSAATDPLSAGWQYVLGLAYLSAGRNPEAIQSFEKTLRLSPEFSLAYYQLGVALALEGQAQAAVEAMKREARHSWRAIGMAIALYALEQSNEKSSVGPASAEQALAELIDNFSERSSYNIAYVYAYRSEADAAFRWLDKAVELNDAGLGELLSQPLFRNLHGDPRWIPFLESLGKAPAQLADIELEVTLPD